MSDAPAPPIEAKSHGRDTHGGRSKVERYGWKVIDQPGEFALLSKHALFVDHSYQRDLSVSRSLAMAAEWSWVACGAISVVPRNEDTKYAIVDGQHRVDAAMRRSDITELPCMLFDFDSVSDEARAFLELNSNRKSMTMAERFNAMRMAGDPPALVLDELANQAGRTVASVSDAGTIACVSKLLRYAETQETILRRVWPLIISLCAGQILNVKLVDAVVRTERGLPPGVSLTQPRWTKRLHSIGYEALLAAIERAIVFRGLRTPVVCAEGLANAVNRGLRGDHLPVPQVRQGEA